MRRMAVHRQQAEMDVVRLRDRSAGTVLVHVAHDEVLQVAAVSRDVDPAAGIGGEAGLGILHGRVF